MRKSFEFLVTRDCNLACKYCSQLCGTDFRGNAQDFIDIEQLTRYAKEVVPSLTPDSQVRVMGGEPTMHPRFLEVLTVMSNLIRPHLDHPIEILSNGFGSKVQAQLDKARLLFHTRNFIDPPGNDYEFTLVLSKSTPDILRQALEMHNPNLRAAQDFFPLDEIERRGETCDIPIECGHGVASSGFYPCSVGVSIATLFKLNVGLDHMPSEDEIRAQKKELCRRCYIPCTRIKDAPIVSPSVEKAIEEWRKEPFYPKSMRTTRKVPPMYV